MQIVDQLMGEKVVDFLEQHAQIEEVPPGTLSQPQWPQGTPNPA